MAACFCHPALAQVVVQDEKVGSSVLQTPLKRRVLIIPLTKIQRSSMTAEVRFLLRTRPTWLPLPDLVLCRHHRVCRKSPKSSNLRRAASMLRSRWSASPTRSRRRWTLSLDRP